MDRPTEGRIASRWRRWISEVCNQFDQLIVWILISLIIARIVRSDSDDHRRLENSTDELDWRFQQGETQQTQLENSMEELNWRVQLKSRKAWLTNSTSSTEIPNWRTPLVNDFHRENEHRTKPFEVRTARNRWKSLDCTSSPNVNKVDFFLSYFELLWVTIRPFYSFQWCTESRTNYSPYSISRITYTFFSAKKNRLFALFSSLSTWKPSE